VTENSEREVKCFCDEYPECVHVLYWCDGFKAGNDALAEAVRKALYDHTVEARRLYVGTSAENFLNWLDKRLAALRAEAAGTPEAGEEMLPRLCHLCL
jgi:hypothetical protein